MANPLRGEIDFDAPGIKEKLRFGIDEIMSVESLLNMGFADLVQSIKFRAPNYRISITMLMVCSGGKIDADAATSAVMRHPRHIWPQLQTLIDAVIPPPPEAGDTDPPETEMAAENGTGQNS